MNRGDLPDGGLSSALVDSTEDLLPAMLRWQQLAGIKAVVGKCRACGGHLFAIEAGEHDAQGEDEQITWYEARCGACGKEVAAPNGRVMRRSSAHLETPGDWLSDRTRRDTEQQRATRQGR